MSLLRAATEIITRAGYAPAMSRRLALATVVAAAVLAPAAGAEAQSSPAGPTDPPPRTPTVERSRLLWATVNVCDTPGAPDTIGIRGSMPGSADPEERMFMRFQVQYFSASDGRWHQVRSGGDSGFVRVGPARFESRQAGRSFRFAPKSGSVLLRGAVTFEWRRGAEVVRRARKRTTAGHRSTAGADPAGYSAANCTITTA
jgi:hypothetical protein